MRRRPSPGPDGVSPRHRRSGELQGDWRAWPAGAVPSRFPVHTFPSFRKFNAGPVRAGAKRYISSRNSRVNSDNPSRKSPFDASTCSGSSRFPLHVIHIIPEIQRRAPVRAGGKRYISSRNGSATSPPMAPISIPTILPESRPLPAWTSSGPSALHVIPIIPKMQRRAPARAGEKRYISSRNSGNGVLRSEFHGHADRDRLKAELRARHARGGGIAAGGQPLLNCANFANSRPKSVQFCSNVSKLPRRPR
jgi:hypothetical protein